MDSPSISMYEKQQFQFGFYVAYWDVHVLTLKTVLNTIDLWVF